MATLTLKQVPDEILERMREDARRQRRSLNQHAIFLLEKALETPRPDFRSAFERFVQKAGPPPDDLSSDLEGLRSPDPGRKVNR